MQYVNKFWIVKFLNLRILSGAKFSAEGLKVQASAGSEGMAGGLWCDQVQ